MAIRQVNASSADKLSAKLFFFQLFQVYDLANARVLDAFARNGQLTVQNYVKYVASPTKISCWELEAQHFEELLKLTPNVSIGCSYDLIKDAVLDRERFVSREQYDLLVIDTPQGLHSDSRGNIHAEHWDFLRMALPLLSATAIVVLYVNKKPYDKDVVGSHGYDMYREYDFKKWMRARMKFYGKNEITEDEGVRRYRTYITMLGRSVESVLITPCFSDVSSLKPYAFRVALSLGV